MDRRERDRDRYHNNTESREKQLKRQAAWRARRRAEDPEFLAHERQVRRDYFRQRYASDPDARAKHLARVYEYQWLNRKWGLR